MINVIYFNQWFSSITPIIQDIKMRHGDSLRIIASSKYKGHVYQSAVDKFIVEDWDNQTGIIKEDDATLYCKWLANQFKENHVDVAFIYKHQDWVHAKKYYFDEICPDVEIVMDFKNMTQLSSKTNMYESLAKHEWAKKYIPEYYRLDKDFDTVIQLIEEQRHLCYKLNSDTGGTSFQRITYKQRIHDANYLERGLSLSEVYYEDAVAYFKLLSKEQRSKIIVMEYLKGPEISIDCYSSRNGFIAIRRCKTDGRMEVIKRPTGWLLTLCECFTSRAFDGQGNRRSEFDFYYPFNIQLRWAEKDQVDMAKITDINPRLSGGAYLGLPLGLNILDVCLMDILAQSDKYDIDKYLKFEESLVTHFETPVKL